MPRLLAVIILSLSLSYSLRSQEAQITDARTQTLGLSDVISLALRQNLSIERSKLQVELRENDLQFEEADSQPNLTGSLGGNLRYFGDGRDPVWDSGDLSESLSGSLNSSVDLYTGGGREAAINQARSVWKPVSRISIAPSSLFYSIRSSGSWKRFFGKKKFRSKPKS